MRCVAVAPPESIKDAEGSGVVHAGLPLTFIEASGAVSKLEFEGVSDDFRAALPLLLHSTAGQPYSELNIASDRDGILDYYFNSGYPQAKFDFRSVPAAEANQMNLTFIVTPGPRIYVRDILVHLDIIH